MVPELAPSPPATPNLSIVIEWENAKLSELDRAGRMLRAVAEQARDLRPQLGGPAEMVILYDRAEIDPAVIHSALTRAQIDEKHLSVRVEPADDLDYYAQKNAGAAAATGDFVLFVDSDVVPNAGWLRTLFDNAVARWGSVVGGNTYLDPTTFIGRTFGLFWFFPLRSETETVEPADTFFANSVIFPRELIQQRPFRPVGVVRGQCYALAQSLRADGVDIWRANGAQATHPAPNGVAHLVRRALCEGHDALALDRALAGEPVDRRLSIKNLAARTVLGFVRRTTDAGKRIVRDRRSVGMPLHEVPVAVALAAGYNVLYAAGEAISAFHPTVIPDNLRV